MAVPKAVKIAVVVVLIWLPLLELVSALDLGFLASRGLVMTRPDLDEAQYADYLVTRHPVLGWPSPETFGKPPLDAIGARLSPAQPDTQARPCVSAFGDSFTFGAQVEAEAAYPKRLAERLGCRVNNFGVGGYGTR